MMNFTIREKLLAIVGAMAFAFVVLIIADRYIATRVLLRLSEIQDHYVPMVELGPRLEAEFEHIQRALQDAVAVNDVEALEETHSLMKEFSDELASVREVVGKTQTEAIRVATNDYYNSAYDVSRRLIAAETGESLVISMTAMQKKRSYALLLLKEATVLDKTKITEAFTAAMKAHTQARRIRLCINILCLSIVLLLSVSLSRGIFRSVKDLAIGFSRFGRGDFSHPIVVKSGDEFGSVAARANQMAAQIDDLLKEKQAHEERLKSANTSLALINKELEAFSYSVAHDLRAPLRSMIGFSNVLLEDYSSLLPQEGKDSLQRVVASAQKMSGLIDGLLSLSRLTRKEIRKESVDLSTVAHGVMIDLQKSNPDRAITMGIEKEIVAEGDTQLLQVVLTNLLGNAWKFSSKKPDARIEFGKSNQNGHATYFVRDNGAGFDMKYADKLFGTFQRLHATNEFEGTGIGLATVQRIVHRHGGEIWAVSEPNKGATFYFTLG